MNAKQVLEEMADLESRIAVIYERFAAQFREAADVGDLWVSMSREEVHHADLLSRAAGGTEQMTVNPSVVEHVHKLQSVVVGYEGTQATIVHLQEALAATVDLEEAEADHLHAHLIQLGAAANTLVDSPAMQHHLRGVLEHAVKLFGTPALQQRVAARGLPG
jgi:truncated hemoglobin YjbI